MARLSRGRSEDKSASGEGEDGNELFHGVLGGVGLVRLPLDSGSVV